MKTKTKNLIAILFLLIVFNNYGQEELLYNKIWEVQSYYSESNGTRSDFFDINTEDNLIGLDGLGYFFVDEETYVGARNARVQSVGEWNLNQAKDSIWLDQTSYKIITLDDDNLVISRSGYDFGSTPEDSIFIESFLEMKPGTFDNPTLSNNDLIKDTDFKGAIIYPLPIVSTFKINLTSDLEIKKIQIFNIIGKEAFLKVFEDSTIEESEIDISKLNSGIYFVKFYDNKNKEFGTKKIIKI